MPYYLGPMGTPYQNGCFEFDVFLPADYPNTPPKVSGGGQNYDPFYVHGVKYCYVCLYYIVGVLMYYYTIPCMDCILHTTYYTYCSIHYYTIHYVRLYYITNVLLTNLYVQYNTIHRSVL